MTRILKILKLLAFGIAGIAAVGLVSGRVYQELSESRDLKRLPPPGAMIEVDGRRMHVHCIGHGSPTVVLELGVGSASFSWYDLHKQLAGITTTCAYDRTGLGYSEPGKVPRRATDVAARLDSLLRAAGIDDDIVLVGWSAGGIYARDFYQRNPQRVRGMLLVDSSHEQQTSRTPRGGSGGADPALAIARYLAPFGLVRLSGALEQRVAGSSSSDEAKDYLRVTYHLSHVLDTVARESAAFNYDINADEPPATMGDLPLIVISRGAPENDPRRSAEEVRARRDARMVLQQELAALSSRGRLVVAERSGHNVHVDQPQLVIDAVRELVTGAGAAYRP